MNRPIATPSRWARRSITCLAFAVALLGVAACGDDDDSGGGGGGGDGGGSAATEAKLPWGTFTLNDRTAQKVESGEELTIKVIGYDASAPFWAPLRDGIADAAEEFGVDAEFVAPAEASTEEQVANFESALTQGVDGLVVITPDPATLTPLIDRAIDEGVPVLTSNIDAPDSKRFAFVGQELVKSGEVAGEEFVKAFYEENEKGGGPYKVITAGSDKAQTYVQDRLEGFTKVLDEAGDFEILDLQSTTFDNTKAFNIVADSFRANPDAVGLYHTDGTIVGGGEVIQRENLKDQVTAVGFNFEPGTEELMKSGAVDASIGQYPYKQGYEPIKYLVEFLQDGTLPDCRPVCDVGAEVANQENVDTFDFGATG